MQRPVRFDGNVTIGAFSQYRRPAPAASSATSLTVNPCRADKPPEPEGADTDLTGPRRRHIDASGDRQIRIRQHKHLIGRASHNTIPPLPTQPRRPQIRRMRNHPGGIARLELHIGDVNAVTRHRAVEFDAHSQSRDPAEATRDAGDEPHGTPAAHGSSVT